MKKKSYPCAGCNIVALLVDGLRGGEVKKKSCPCAGCNIVALLVGGLRGGR